jgi:hypothetical protein
MSPQDYAIRFTPFNGAPFTLSHLGYQFENALLRMRRFRHSQLSEDLLFRERVHTRYPAAHIRHDHPADPLDCPGELCTTPTAIILLPQEGDPRRIAISEMTDSQVRDHALHMGLEEGGSLILSRMGSLLDPLAKEIARLGQALLDQTRRGLSDWMPQADPGDLDRAARLMLDGRSTSQKNLMQTAPGLGLLLQAALLQTPLAAEYTFLRTHCGDENLGFGIKRGLWGSQESTYLWILALAQRSGKVIVEATPLGVWVDDDNQDPGKATYLFRMPQADPVCTQPILDNYLSLFSRAFRAVNHRREPIYLSEELLAAPRYARYLHAVRKIPQLRQLRNLFITRIMHRSDDQWLKDCQQQLDTHAAPTKETTHG